MAVKTNPELANAAQAEAPAAHTPAISAKAAEKEVRVKPDPLPLATRLVDQISRSVFTKKLSRADLERISEHASKLVAFTGE